MILSVGLGAVDTGFAEFGEVTDRKTRAELLDEGLDILTGLWRGQPFHYEGKHYHIKETNFFPPPPPVQQPRIPIWVVGAWPRTKSMARALRYDGLLPNVIGDDGKIREMTPADVRDMCAYVATNRTATAPYDIVVEGRTPGDDRTAAISIMQPWAAADATCLFNFTWTLSDKPDRTPADDELMIHSAHASRYHWNNAGDVVNYLRGDWQIAHVYTLLNLPERALHYAQLCLRQCEDQHLGDFDLAFAYEGVARALACHHERVEAEKFYRLADAAGHQIAEAEDRELFFDDLSKPPWYGLK